MLLVHILRHPAGCNVTLNRALPGAVPGCTAQRGGGASWSGHQALPRHGSQALARAPGWLRAQNVNTFTASCRADHVHLGGQAATCLQGLHTWQGVRSRTLSG